MFKLKKTIKVNALYGVRYEIWTILLQTELNVLMKYFIYIHNNKNSI